MFTLFAVIALFLLPVILWGVYNFTIAEKIASELRTKHGLDEIFVALEDRAFIGLKFATKQLILGKGRGRDRVYRFSQITSVEVQQDGVTITSTDRGSQLLGGAVGALAFGGLGAVVGGLSGSTKAVSNIRRMSLLVMVDDRSYPAHNICFFDLGQSGTASNTAAVKAGRARVEKFHAHIVNAMRQAQAEVAPLTPTPVVDSASGKLNTDDLRALWELKEKGILTEDEFQLQKARLLV